MNMLSAARATAELLKCKHTECPKAVLCASKCVEPQQDEQANKTHRLTPKQ